MLNFFEIIVGSVYALTALSAVVCAVMLFMFHILKKPLSAKFRYTFASILCILLHILNFGFIRYVFIVPIALFGVAFLLINNYCFPYFTPRIKRLNGIMYMSYILHSLILPDTNIRGFHYVMLGVLRHSSLVFEPGQEPTIGYIFMENLISFLYCAAAVLFVVTVILLITQLVLCKKQKNSLT